MSVRYKFKSEAEFSQILFDGIYISVADVKKEIFRQRKLGKSENVDLKISDAETKESYPDDDNLISKNTSLIVVRVPSTQSGPKFNKFAKISKPIEPQTAISRKFDMNSKIYSMKGTEEEKIMAMMMQSTVDYRSSFQNFSNPPPSNYLCRKCHIPGHFIRNCPLNSTSFSNRYNPKERRENNKMTGIPMSMRNNVESQQFYTTRVDNFDAIPKALICEICNEIYRNPVMTPCCRETFCFDCVESKLLGSEEHECPKCCEKYVLPGSLLANQEIRGKVRDQIMNLKGNEKESGHSLICSY